MKKKVGKTIANILIAALCVAIFAFYEAKAFQAFEKKWLVCLLSVIGLAIAYVVYPVIHELGHVVFGKFAGLRTGAICAGIFCVDYSSGTPSFSLRAPTADFGYTVMLPTDKSGYPSKYAVSAAGGLAFSLLTIIVGLTFAVNFTGSVYVFCLIAAPYPLALYILLVNMFPFSDDSDGTVIYKTLTESRNSDFFRALDAVAAVELGAMPKDLTPSLIVKRSDESDKYGKILAYLRYLSLLYTDTDGALRTLSGIDENGYLGAEIEKEKFFAAIIGGDDKYLKRNENAVLPLISTEKSPSDFRIHAAYRIYMKEYDWAKLVIKGGLNFLNGHRKNGISYQEKEYLENMYKELG